MSKKQSDGNIGETLGALWMAWAKHPEIARAVFYAAQDIGDSLRAAFAPKPQSNMAAASSNARQELLLIDEQPEAFTTAPLWTMTEDQPAGFVNGFF